MLFINNVRVAQIFRIINVRCDSFRAIIMMTAGYHGFFIRINGDISQ